MKETYTQIAAGLRRITPAHVIAEATAKQFESLPERPSKGQILAAFKRAATPLRTPPRLRDAIDVLMSWSQEQDWDDDSRPIVWPSNRVLQDELGLSVRQVQYTLVDLVKANLIVPVDSPTGRRWGRRHPRTHKIVEAYGYDLSPLAVRYQEFQAVAERAREERALRAQLRRRLTIARKAIQQIASAALEQGLVGEDWATWAEMAVCSAQALSEDEPLKSMSAVVEYLERQRDEGEEALRRAILSDEIAGSPESDCTPITTTNQPPADTSAHCKDARQKPSSRADLASRSTSGASGEAPNLTSLKISPTFVLSVAPRLGSYVASDRPTWADIVDAADWVRSDLGISRPAWVEACEVMGRYEAASAVAVIAAKGDQIRSPGGYLRGMTEKARTGDLRLGKSFYGLLDQLGDRTTRI